MNSDNYLRLRDALAVPAYAGLSNAEAAAMLNAPTVERTRRFEWREARRKAILAGRWSMVLVRARQTPSLPPVTGLDRAILAAINATSMEVDQEIDPAIEDEWQVLLDGLDALVASNDLTAEVADAIRALGAEAVSPASEIGWPAVSEHDVAHARGMA